METQTPIQPQPQPQILIQCSVCGLRFDPDEEVTACQVCPLGGLTRRCGLVRCPQCGFEQPAPRGHQAQVRRRSRGGGQGGGLGRGNGMGRGPGAGWGRGAGPGGARAAGNGPGAGSGEPGAGDDGFGVTRLNDLAEGERARVLKLEARGAGLHKLLAMGVLPGVEVVMVQARPVPVIQTGYTTLAIDQQLAEEVAVLRLEPGRGPGGRGGGGGRGRGRGRGGWGWGRRRREA